MSLTKLESFTKFIVEQNLVDKCKIDSWMENGRLVPAAKDLGLGFLICRFEYDAVISIEHFNGDEKLFFALVCAWLHDYDPGRDKDELQPPDIDVDIVDDCKADVDIKIEFREDVEIVEDDQGLIPFNGKRWSLSKVPLDIVEEAAVDDTKGRTLDKSYRHGDIE